MEDDDPIEEYLAMVARGEQPTMELPLSRRDGTTAVTPEMAAMVDEMGEILRSYTFNYWPFPYRWGRLNNERLSGLYNRLESE